MAKSEVATAEEYTPITYGTDVAAEWETLASEADRIPGMDLINSEMLESLLNVPLLIHKVTYRDGIQEKGAPYRSDYVSCEAIVAPLHILEEAERKGRLKVADLTVDPGQFVVFNDGSSGIYRQITSYLFAKGLIALPGPIVESGPKGECSYDLPRSGWTGGQEDATDGIPIRLQCPRGIRTSSYETAEYGDARTHYLA